MDTTRHGHRQRTSLLARRGRKRDSPVCERFSRAVRIGDDEWKYVPMNCKSKHCPRCAPRLAARRARQIERAARQHNLRFFLTLTQASGELSPNELLRKLRATWTKLRTYFVRRCRQTMIYITIVEVSGSGNPHLHVLLHQDIDERWLADTWANLGGGEFVSVRRVTDLTSVCRYVAKQIAHPPENALPPGTRLLTKSRDIHFADDRGSSRTRTIFAPVDDLRTKAGEHFVRDEGQGFVADTGDLR